jgi:hypothetical protein
MNVGLETVEAVRKFSAMALEDIVHQCSRCGMCHGTSRWTCCKAIFETLSYFAIMQGAGLL